MMTERVTTEYKWDTAVYAAVYTLFFQKLILKQKFYWIPLTSMRSQLQTKLYLEKCVLFKCIIRSSPLLYCRCVYIPIIKICYKKIWKQTTIWQYYLSINLSEFFNIAFWQECLSKAWLVTDSTKKKKLFHK